MGSKIEKQGFLEGLRANQADTKHTNTMEKKMETTIMENEMEKKMENEMETRVYIGVLSHLPNPFKKQSPTPSMLNPEPYTLKWFWFMVLKDAVRRCNTGP